MLKALGEEPKDHEFIVPKAQSQLEDFGLIPLSQGYETRNGHSRNLAEKTTGYNPHGGE